jgi:hypothetical protein
MKEIDQFQEDQKKQIEAGGKSQGQVSQVE